jgi:lipoate-protein ligase B
VEGEDSVYRSGRKEMGHKITDSLNVNTDLSYFDMIVPCGIENVKTHHSEVARKMKR